MQHATCIYVPIHTHTHVHRNYAISVCAAESFMPLDDPELMLLNALQGEPIPNDFVRARLYVAKQQRKRSKAGTPPAHGVLSRTHAILQLTTAVNKVYFYN